MKLLITTQQNVYRLTPYSKKVIYQHLFFMKNLIVVIMVSLFTITTQAQNSISYNRPHQDRKTAYLLADRVNIRAKASPKATVIAQLPIGKKVKILSTRVGESLTINGYKQKWCKVEFKDNQKIKRGFVWAGLLSLIAIKKEEQFLFGVEKIVSKKFMNDYMVQLRAAKNGKELDKIVFKAIGDDANYLNYKITDGKGLKNVKNIIKISFSADICDYPNGSAYIFWTGKQFIMAGDDDKMQPSVGCFYDNIELVFPTDKGGKSGKMIAVRTYHDEEENENSKPKVTKTVFHWDGKQMKR